MLARCLLKGRAVGGSIAQYTTEPAEWFDGLAWSDGEIKEMAMRNRLAVLSGVVLMVCLGGARAEAQSAPNPWVPCGSLENLRNGANRCEINGFPVEQWEYGFAFNSREVYVANCLFWNVGMRVVNRIPYAVNSDNPSAGWQLGGAVFYTETFAADDDIPNSCPSGTWRHRYWRITGNGDVATDIFSNGCFNQPLFCRRRT